eukprot:3964550-Amphidinium_carterae.1
MSPLRTTGPAETMLPSASGEGRSPRLLPARSCGGVVMSLGDGLARWPPASKGFGRRARGRTPEEPL